MRSRSLCACVGKERYERGVSNVNRGDEALKIDMNGLERDAVQCIRGCESRLKRKYEKCAREVGK